VTTMDFIGSSIASLIGQQDPDLRRHPWKSAICCCPGGEKGADHWAPTSSDPGTMYMLAPERPSGGPGASFIGEEMSGRHIRLTRGSRPSVGARREGGVRWWAGLRPSWAG
jgi:hypothetical protein